MPHALRNLLLIFVAPLTCAGVMGCSRGESSRIEAPLRDHGTGAVSSPAEQNASASSSLQGTLPLQQLQTEGSETPLSPSEQKASALFDALLAPGSSEEDWNRSLEQLLAQGESATRVLAARLSRGTDPEREMAATTLALLGPAAVGAAAELRVALNDPLPFVQANAAATLIQLPDHSQEAIPALTRLLFGGEPQLRQLAAVNLNAAGVVLTEQVAPLRQVLQEEQSSEILAPVVELLGRIGKPAQSALPELKKIAIEQPGDLGSAATSAIQLISGEQESETKSAQ